MISFPPYHLDAEEERVWKGDSALALRRKPFAILRYLAQNPKRLVTHDELLAEVWAGTVVSESAVRSHLYELRQVLGDGVIETVVGRGYRFIAPVVLAGDAGPAPREPRSERLVVGRDAELAQLRAAFERATTGHRAVCFVSGEPGIGKTTLVDAFVDELGDQVIAVRGSCIEQFGAPEAYLALIEVIGKLRRSARGDQILPAFVRHAPTFLAKVPHLVSDEQLSEVMRRAQGGSEARMLRELVEALEVAASQDVIVIVLEDLQWSDLATIDVLNLLAQRTERAKLLVIGTARRVAIQTADHPLSRIVKSLVARAGARSIALDRIEAASVGELVARRFPDHAFPPELVAAISSITGGTPLFVVTLIDDLVGRGMLAERDGRWQLTVSLADVAAHRPDSIKQLIDIQLDRLEPDEQRMLEVASLVGASFESGPIAAALGRSEDEVDDRCDALARRGLFLRREPTGYAVTHALVQEVCEERSSPAKRQRWHLAIAAHLERAFAGETRAIARVLATHLDKAGQVARAVEHYIIGGHQTALRFASADAVALFERARALLPKMPRTPERDATELRLLAVIGQLLIRTPYSGGDPLNVYERALELAREIGDVANEYAALANLCLRRGIHAELDQAAALARELVALEAKHALDPMLVEYGTNVRAFVGTYRGELPDALAMFERLLANTARSTSADEIIHPTSMLGPIVRTAISRSYAAICRFFLGAPDHALREARQAVEEARRLDDPIALGITENFLVRIHFMRRDPLDVVEEVAQTVVKRATAGWVVLEETRCVAMWAACHRTPLPASAADGLVDSYRARIAKVSLGAPNSAATIGDALWISGHRDHAREVIELGIAYAETWHELLYLPDLLLSRGDYADDPDQAAAAYREAHARAIALAAPIPALRAATRLRDDKLIAECLALCPEPDAARAIS